MAAPTLEFSTGIAVAFPRSPMLAAGLAWELAENTQGRFRLGPGQPGAGPISSGGTASPSNLRGPGCATTSRPSKRASGLSGARSRCPTRGPYYKLTLLPAMWAPRRHAFGDVKVDVSAVGPWMCRMAGEVADGIHVHPFHSVRLPPNRLCRPWRRERPGPGGQRATWT